MLGLRVILAVRLYMASAWLPDFTDSARARRLAGVGQSARLAGGNPVQAVRFDVLALPEAAPSTSVRFKPMRS